VTLDAQIASPPLFLEYEEMLKRAEHRLRHGLDLEQANTLLRSLAAIIEPVEVHFYGGPSFATSMTKWC
jgi:hypothetical protein